MYSFKVNKNSSLSKERPQKTDLLNQLKYFLKYLFIILELILPIWKMARIFLWNFRIFDYVL